MITDFFYGLSLRAVRFLFNIKSVIQSLMYRMKKFLCYYLFALILLSACNQSGDPVEQNFTVPSWTLYQRALQSGKSVKEAKTLLVLKDYPYNINTTINGNPSNQMGIAWFTNASVAGGVVQIVEGKVNNPSAFTNAREIQAISVVIDSVNYVSIGNESRNNNEELITATGFIRGEKRSYTSNKALMDNLKPNTTYSYRVGKKGAWSEIGSFTTAGTGKEAFEFIYITDTQAYTDAMYNISKKTIETATAYTPNARFLLITGDLNESNGAESSEWEWEQWFEKMQNTWLHLPIVPVQGNHDISPFSHWSHHFNTDHSFNMQQTDPNAQTAMNGTIYSFVYGNALMLVINFEDMAKGEPYFAALEQWIRRQVIAHSDVKWKIVTFHKSMFTGHSGRLAGQEGITIRERFASIFQELGIDFVIQGHDHLYQVIGVLAVDGTNYSHLADAVSNQTIVTPTPADGRTITTDVTGKQGGTFDVSNGMIFFLNNSAGKTKNYPNSKEQIEATFPQHGIKDFFDMLNKFGQTGEPTFSRIRVATEAIDITTFAVDDNGTVTLFDAFRIVKN